MKINKTLNTKEVSFLMGRKSKFTIDEKMNAVLDYKNSKRSVIQICNDLRLHPSGYDLYKWIHIYDTHGEIGFLPKERNKTYSKILKDTVVKAYLDGEGSYDELAIQYNILSSSTLKNWVKKYNSHIELKDYNPQGDIYMTKARKTTLQERIEIVHYCIEHDMGYKLAAREYDVSYAQAYQWTQKYLEAGEDGLVDKRGKHKNDDEVDELTLLKRENERLKKKLEIKEMETQLLKKVKEIERRRYSPKGNKK